MADDAGPSWHDTVIAERLITDREFQDRVFDSPLSNQSWELVMTAVELDVDRPEDHEQARMVADTDKLDNVLPAIRDIEARQGGGSGRSGSGFVDRLLGSIGLGNGSAQEYRDEAERLAADYAQAFQRTLEDRGQWETVCERAAEESG